MYSAPITRARPTAFVLLLDQSGSMAERIVFEGSEMTKARAMSLITSGFIDELIFRARREGGPRDYYDISVLSYGGGGVRSILSPRGEWARPSRLAARAVRRETVSVERMLPDGRSLIAAVERNKWIEVEAFGATPMCAALGEAAELVERWIRRNGTNYPPAVINITDGEASDGQADRVRELAAKISAARTEDGGTVLMNICLAGDDKPVIFPSSIDELPTHRYARLLWEVSSWMPASYDDMIRSLRSDADGGPFRALGWGCGIASVAAMMNIGSVNSVML